MFAKVFSQIFDSSIARDYKCRRMFMDLLVLSDSSGAVDMTSESISRHTNVPLKQVVKYIEELCKPDPESRSPLHEGRRLVQIDSNRGWGWKIVNYEHYRDLRNEEARRSYFRDYQRKRRSKNVKDRRLTDFKRSEPLPLPLSTQDASSSKSKPSSESEVVEFCQSTGIPQSDAEYYWSKWVGNGFKNNKESMKDWRAVIRSHQRAGYLPSQKGNNGTYKRNSAGSGRNIGTANEGRSSQYAGVGKLQ